MSRILFAHGHLLRFDSKQFAIGKPYPPLATITAAAYLRTLGHDVALYDPTLDDDTRGFAAALERAQPQVLVLYDDVFNWFTKMCLSRMREAALEMIEKARAGGVRVVVSGHDAADAPQVYLKAGAEFVVVGEGEITLGELLARMESNGVSRNGHGDTALASQAFAPAPQAFAPAPQAFAPAPQASAPARTRYDDIPGLVYSDMGMQRRTGPRALLKELDTLPLAAWDLIDIERYRAFWKQRHGYFSLNVVTTRGCPYLCNWCAKPVYGNTYHIRSPEQVVDEIRLLRERYAPDHLWFCDDIFGLKKRWLMPFAEQIAREGLVTPFLCQTRADLMTDENVDALRRAGCAEAWMGVESGAQSILDAMDKGITLDQVRGAVSRLRAAGIRIGFFLQLGYPGERWPEIEMTRRMVRDLAPDEIGISVSYPLPGTKFHERVSTKLGEKRNWNESSDLDPLFSGAFSREFYQALSRTLHAEFRTRRALRVARSLARDPLSTDAGRLRALGGLAELPRWVAGRARLRLRRMGV